MERGNLVKYKESKKWSEFCTDNKVTEFYKNIGAEYERKGAEDK